MTETIRTHNPRNPSAKPDLQWLMDNIPSARHGAEVQARLDREREENRARFERPDNQQQGEMVG